MRRQQPTLKDLLKRWYLLMNQHIDLQLKAQGLARSQFQVLWLMQREKQLTQKQLVERLGVSEATLSGILENTVAKGYIKRQPNPEDKRVNMLTLTPAGRKKIASTPNPAETLSRQMLKDLPAGEVKQLTRSMERIIANLEATIKE